MRAVAACQFTFSRFGAWHLAIACVTACVWAAWVAWLVWQSTPPRSMALAALAAALLVALCLARSLASLAAISLRWDGRKWHLGPLDSVGNEPLAGALAVAIDLGGWMLLRFEADSGPGARVRWLPAQRRGLQGQWHALRCAVYSPRLARDAAHDADAAATP